MRHPHLKEQQRLASYRLDEPRSRVPLGGGATPASVYFVNQEKGVEPLLPSRPVPGTQALGLLGFRVNKQITELL